MQISEYKSSPLYTVHRQWAIAAARDFRYRFPDVKVSLYEAVPGFQLLAHDCGARFDQLKQDFHRNIRPLTCPVELVHEVPQGAAPVDEQVSYDAEIWLSGAPISVIELDNLLTLADGKIPAGTLDYVHTDNGWVFTSPTVLLDADQQRVIAAAQRILRPHDIRFAVQPDEPPRQRPAHPDMSPSMALASSRSDKFHSSAIRQLVAADEDSWRTFLNLRAAQNVTPAASPPDRFACLFDTADQSDICLSELLTLYDRIDVIPDRRDSNWLAKHHTSIADFQELVRLGRCRLVVPYSAAQCDPQLLASVADADPGSVVLSRSLAMQTIQAGQYKDPLMYGPLSAFQRSSILHTLYHTATDDRFKHILNSYGDIFRRQQRELMINGAYASLTSGVGIYLGDLRHRLTNQDARLQLSAAGAGVEWALGLGASFIPRSFSQGYDETTLCHFIASFMGRTRAKPVDPVAERMHLLVDGLLAVSNVPPLEVARDFHSAATDRFKGLAARLMHQAPSRDEMQHAVDQINADTKAFEGRTAFLSKWKLDTLAVGVVTKHINDTLDAQVPYASLFAAWLYEQFKARVPAALKDELSFATQIMLGLATSPSLDAVVVSRSRATLK